MGGRHVLDVLRELIGEAERDEARADERALVRHLERGVLRVARAIDVFRLHRRARADAVATTTVPVSRWITGTHDVAIQPERQPRAPLPM
jgi:hypothetical protein